MNLKKFRTIIAVLFCSAVLNVHAEKYIGMDLSLLPSYEASSSTTYKDINGNTITDMLGFVKEHGINTVRVRLFVDPADDGTGVVQDINYVKALGKRIKAKGLRFLLDFHYSDTWADPQKQYIPRSWNTSASAIEDSLYSYTKRMLKILVANDATPDFIQIGNEISYGMCSMTATYNSTSMTWTKGSDLYPCYTNTSSTDNWSTLVAMLNKASSACREICSKAKIILHTERSGDATTTSAIYTKLSGVDYDIIGLSYYPFWHGYLPALATTLNTLESSFSAKPVMIVETAYYYQYFPASGNNFTTTDKWPATEAGQKQYIDDLVSMLKTHDNVEGLFYWFPEENGNGTRTGGATNTIISSWINRGLFDNTSGIAKAALYDLKNLEKTYSVVISNTADFATSKTIPMSPDLFRRWADTSIETDYEAHAKDTKRWQLGIKYDNKALEDLGYAKYDGKTIYWYIVDSDGNQYRPIYTYNSTVTYGGEVAMANADSKKLGDGRIYYQSYDNITPVSATPSSTAVFTTTNNSVSYTFSFANAVYKTYVGTSRYHLYYSQDGKPSAQLWKNTSGITATSTDNFYLLANINSDGAASDENGTWATTTAKKMTPIQYTDSLVYQAIVNKPTGGSFTTVFFAFLKGADYDSWTGSSTDWDKLYRPEIHDNRDCSDDESTLHSVYYDFNDTYGSGEQEQAACPTLIDDQLSADCYIVRLNVTTGTYNIQFLNGKYIFGPGVTNMSDGGSWTANNAIQMTYHDGGYYSADVTMTVGGKFGFYDVIEKSKKYSYIEDTDAPATDGEAAPATAYGDVPYMNHIAQTDYTNDGNNTFSFLLPSRRTDTSSSTYKCQIRLYPSTYNSSSDANTSHSNEWFYTYERPIKVFTNGTLGWYTTTFASNYPMVFDNNDAANPNPTMTIYRANYTAEANNINMVSGLDYIPAKTGVMLKAVYSSGATVVDPRARVDADKLSETYTDASNKLQPVYLNDAANRHISFAETSSYNSSDKSTWKWELEADATANGYDATKVWKGGDAVAYRNYLYYFVDGTTYPVFVRSKDGTSFTERAYLHLSGTEVGVPYLNGFNSSTDAYNRVESLYDPTTASGAKRYNLGIIFDGVEENDGTITGINNVNVKGNVNGDFYYTLQGVRISRPLAKGIYIYKGKSLLVK